MSESEFFVSLPVPTREERIANAEKLVRQNVDTESIWVQTGLDRPTIEKLQKDHDDELYAAFPNWFSDELNVNGRRVMRG